MSEAVAQLCCRTCYHGCDAAAVAGLRLRSSLLRMPNAGWKALVGRIRCQLHCAARLSQPRCRTPLLSVLCFFIMPVAVAHHVPVFVPLCFSVPVALLLLALFRVVSTARLSQAHFGDDAVVLLAPSVARRRSLCPCCDVPAVRSARGYVIVSCSYSLKASVLAAPWSMRHDQCSSPLFLYAMRPSVL